MDSPKGIALVVSHVPKSAPLASYGEDFFVQEEQIMGLVALPADTEEQRLGMCRGLIDWKHTGALCRSLVDRVELLEGEGEGICGFAFQEQVVIGHPARGFEVSGALLCFAALVDGRGDILLCANELSGSQNASQVQMSPYDPCRFSLKVTAAQYELMSYPAFPSLVRRLEINSSAQDLYLVPALVEKTAFYLTGKETDVNVSLTGEDDDTFGGGCCCQVAASFMHNGARVTVYQRFSIEQVRPYIKHRFGRKTDSAASIDDERPGSKDSGDDLWSADFSGLLNTLLLLPWPLATPPFRLELGSWEEESLDANVFLDGEPVGSISLGPRSTLFDARNCIERAELVPLGNKFLFQVCMSRLAEVSYVVFETSFPDIHLQTVEEYSDEEDSEDERFGENAFGDLGSPLSDLDHKASKKAKKTRSKRALKKKRSKRRRKKKRGSLIDRLMRPEALEPESNQDEQAEAEEAARIAAELQKKKEEEERKKKDTIFFEELIQLPGTVSVRTGDMELSTSVDLMDHLERGASLEVEGIRCIVSKDKDRQFNPSAVPLKNPFDVYLGDDDAEETGDGGGEQQQEEEEEGTESSSSGGGGGGDPAHQQQGQEKKKQQQRPEFVLDVVESYTDVVAYRVDKTPARAVELKGALVTVEEGSKTIVTSIDLRYKLKPGDVVRVDDWNIVTLSSDPEDAFEENELTLAEEYNGPSGSKLKFDKVVLQLASDKEKQRSLIEKERKALEAKQRQKALEEELSQTEEFFGITMSWRRLVPFLGATPYNMRQQDFWDQVTLRYAIKAVYQMMCEKWFPASEGLDNVKFVKLMRELPGIDRDKVTSTDIDLIFARCKSKGERRLTMKEFVDGALVEVARLIYPWLEDKPAQGKFLKEIVFEWNECQRLMWVEAKRLAVVEEARRQCAAIKIQSVAHRSRMYKLYKLKRKSAIMIQKKIKSYKHRQAFLDTVAAARRAKNIAKAEAESKRRGKKGSRLYATVRLIGGVANIVTVFRHTKGSIMILCYNPIDSVAFKFNVTIEQLRKINEEATSISGLENEELYKVNNLRYVLERLQYRKRVGVKVLVLGRKPNKEAGKKLLVQAAYIQCTDKTKVVHIVSITFSRNEYTFQAYDPVRGVTKSVVLPRKKLCAWFDFDEEKEKQNVPELLRPENQADLLQWMIRRMLYCSACALSTHHAIHRRGDSVLMLECEIADQRENNMAARIQGLWRKYRSRQRIRVLIARAYRKQWDPSTSRWYYVRFDTGAVSWERPKLLGSMDLPEPPDAWEETYDENGNVYYYHPLTGRMSWYSEDKAATFIQRLWRQKNAAEFQMDLADLVKAMSFQRQSELAYERSPAKLASIANYALLVHTRDQDYAKAKKLYKEAIELAPNSPLLLFSYGIFTLANNGYPRKETYDEAMRMIDRAHQLDPKLDKFKTARNAFFHFAVLSRSHNAQSWLNYALIMQCVNKDFDRAEKYYRKALDLGKGDESVLANYDDFMEGRLPGGRYAGGGPGVIVAKRSYELYRDGEWVQMQDPEAKHEKFAIFWMNYANHKTQWQEPNWHVEWIQRRKRGQVVQTKDGWSQMWDTVSQAYFYIHFEKAESTWVCPEYLEHVFLANNT